MPNPASHELIDHTSEVQLRLRADSLGGLLAEAGRALAGLQFRGAEAGITTGPRRLHVSAADRESLLVDWLNELIYRADSEREVPAEFDLRAAGETGVGGRFRGVPVPESPALVKAATLHGAKVETTARGLEGDVILDV